MMSISDGSGPSIVSRKMQRMRPMREVLFGKGAYFPPELTFPLRCLSMKELFPICTLNWHLDIYVSRQGEINTRSESTETEQKKSTDANELFSFFLNT